MSKFLKLLEDSKPRTAEFYGKHYKIPDNAVVIENPSSNFSSVIDSLFRVVPVREVEDLKWNEVCHHYPEPGQSTHQLLIVGSKKAIDVTKKIINTWEEGGDKILNGAAILKNAVVSYVKNNYVSNIKDIRNNGWISFDKYDENINYEVIFISYANWFFTPSVEILDDIKDFANSFIKTKKKVTDSIKERLTSMFDGSTVKAGGNGRYRVHGVTGNLIDVIVDGENIRISKIDIKELNDKAIKNINRLLKGE